MHLISKHLYIKQYYSISVYFSFISLFSTVKCVKIQIKKDFSIKCKLHSPVCWVFFFFALMVFNNSMQLNTDKKVSNFCFCEHYRPTQTELGCFSPIVKAIIFSSFFITFLTFDAHIKSDSLLFCVVFLFCFFNLRNIAKEKELRTPDFLFIPSITINKENHSLLFL